MAKGGKVAYAVKLSPEVKELVREYCKARGIKQGHFVEVALKEKLEREEALEDALEFRRWRHEEGLAIDFEEYLKKRG